MRILYCNIGLASRSGSEVVTLETAKTLSRLGHDICVYAGVVGRSSEALVAAGIPVLTGLENIPWQPDVIHSNHLPQSIETAAQFPGTPQIFVCHDASAWHSKPPALSVIRQWGAVDEICAERIERTINPPPSVNRLPNAVDMDAYRRRSPLPEKPQNALALVKHRSHLAAIKAACKRAGLRLDVFGSATNNVVDDLPARLPAYDIVFASARMALESMATGCSVIAVDGRGLAGLVTSRNVEHWRQHNFGQRLLTNAVTADALHTEINLYQNMDAARVTDFIRETASLSAYCERLVNVYETAISDFEKAPTEPSITLREVFAETLAFFDHALTQASPIETCDATAPSLTQLWCRIESDLGRFKSRNFLMQQLAKTVGRKLMPPR